jgi:hypothetical protein
MMECTGQLFQCSAAFTSSARSPSSLTGVPTSNLPFLAPADDHAGLAAPADYCWCMQQMELMVLELQLSAQLGHASKVPLKGCSLSAGRHSFSGVMLLTKELLYVADIIKVLPLLLHCF